MSLNFSELTLFHFILYDLKASNGWYFFELYTINSGEFSFKN